MPADIKQARKTFTNIFAVSSKHTTYEAEEMEMPTAPVTVSHPQRWELL